MTRELAYWTVGIVGGIVVAAFQLGDGLLIHRPEARVPLFLGGVVVATGAALKLIAVLTDPEFREKRRAGAGRR